MNPESAHPDSPPQVDLQVRLGRLQLPNPILVASGTFGYAGEMQRWVDLSRLGGLVPKTVTRQPRPGNTPWRTVETAAGMLNSIGLDNDGIERFLSVSLPLLHQLACPVIVSLAGSSIDDFVTLTEQLQRSADQLTRRTPAGLAAIELNISCPNVSHGVDFGTDPELCRRVVSQVRSVTDLPVLAKLTPNVTRIAEIAAAAAEGGADAVSVINTLLGMAVDWRRQRPMLGNVLGGLSGPAIKPIALRCVYQIAQATAIPIVGIGGIATIDDVMEFLVAGASAIQLGTVNFYDPTVSMRILDQLPAALTTLNAQRPADIVGTLRSPA